jgi:hypothetical protein
MMTLANSRLLMRRDSEYVVEDATLVYPRYVINYQVDGNLSHEMWNRLSLGYVKHGQFGCAQCDSQVFGSYQGNRCDCEQEPMIDPQDVIL